MSRNEIDQQTGNPPCLNAEAIVLLVDDQMMVCEGIRRMLESESDIVFHFCNDPHQALARALEVKPTVILQDIIMPDIDGYSLLRSYRENEIMRYVPDIKL